MTFCIANPTLNVLMTQIIIKKRISCFKFSNFFNRQMEI